MYCHVWHLWQSSHNCPIEAVNHPCAAVGNQPHVTGLAWLKAHGRSRGNVQPIPKSGISIKGESRVGLGEMIMTPNLDRSVACVCDFKRRCGSILIQNTLASCSKKLAWYRLSA